MRKNLILWVSVISLIVISCQTNEKKKNNSTNEKKEKTMTEDKPVPVPFIIGEKYFVKNTVKSISNFKIDTQQAFDQIFGAATVMGKDGKPTPIDFSKQYVIALVEPITEFASEIKDINVVKNTKNEIEVNYTVEKGEKQSFTTRPSKVLIVDKSYDGVVTLSHQH